MGGNALPQPIEDSLWKKIVVVLFGSLGCLTIPIFIYAGCYISYWFSTPTIQKEPLHPGEEVAIYDTKEPALFLIEELPSAETDYAVRGTFIPLIPEDAEEPQIELLHRVKGHGTIIFGSGSIDIDTEFDDCKFAVHFKLNGEPNARWWNECTYLASGEKVRANSINIRFGEDAWSKPTRVMRETGQDLIQDLLEDFWMQLIFERPMEPESEN
jgi:hypothetical protein